MGQMLLVSYRIGICKVETSCIFESVFVEKILTYLAAIDNKLLPPLSELRLV